MCDVADTLPPPKGLKDKTYPGHHYKFPPLKPPKQLKE